MTNLTRQAIETVSEALGRARQSLVTKLGDNSLNPAAQLRLEAALCRLRGSTLFHDSDYCANFPVFGADDLVGLGIQGARAIGATAPPAAFPVPGNNQAWYPGFYGPPCSEGWGLWGYNAWKAYQPSPLTSQFGEPNAGAGRTAYTYPVRYDNIGANTTNTYQRVTLWESARYISFYNSRASAISPSATTVKVTLTADDLAGLQVNSPLSGLPLDFAVYSHPLLVQGNGNPASWESIALPVQGEPLIPVTFALTPAGNNWDLTLNILPSLNTWSPGKWWHVVFYWRSTDPNLSSATALTLTPHADTGSDITAFKWPRKNFFHTDIPDRLAWEKDYINNPSPYLVARGRVHYVIQDGNYSTLNAPSKCSLPTSWPASASGLAGALVGYIDVPNGSAVGVLLVVSTGPDGSTSPSVIVGPEITPEFWPNDWATCPYFPSAPYESVVIARAVVVRAPGVTIGLVEAQQSNYQSTTNIYARLAIAWLEQSVPSHALSPLGDVSLAATVLPALTNLSRRYRILNPTESLVFAAFNILVSSVGLPDTIAPNSSVMTDPNGLASTVFIGLLKNPFISTIVSRPDGEPLAVPFSASARGLIEDLASSPPSTELLRFDADKLALTGQVLGIPTSLEVYMVPSGECSSVDPHAAGTKLGRDYTFRLVLEDGSQNQLTKDWYIMASKYFLTPQEFAQQSLLSSTQGYFTQSTLSNIDQWRLYGYAGVVPDISMGYARPLLTRVVSPPDNTKVTEAQFVANLVAQGKTQAQINEAIRQYIDPLEDNNTFYVVDLSQYGNDFTLVKNASLSVTTYSFDTVPYYAVNFSSFGANGTSSTTDLRADSFFIAQSGLPVGALESGGPAATPYVRGGFNAQGLGVSANLPPANPCRVVGNIYKIESSWAFDITNMPSPTALSIYPRAVFNQGTSAWEYLRFSRDVWIIIRLFVGGVIVDKFANFYQYDVANNSGKPSPISLGPDLADSVVYLGVGKVQTDLQTPTHGAPPGDILVLRSS